MCIRSNEILKDDDIINDKLIYCVLFDCTIKNGQVKYCKLYNCKLENVLVDNSSLIGDTKINNVFFRDSTLQEDGT